MVYACFLILLPATFAQYGIEIGMKPDVRFDEKNERYDIGPLMDPGDYVEQDYRRQGAMRPQSANYDSTQNTKNILRLIDDKFQQGRSASPADKTMISQLVNLLDQVRRAGDGKMKNMDHQMKYSRNLDRFREKGTRRTLVQYLHGQPESHSRRSGLNPDKEVLLHHAVPIVINVQGFLKMPVGGE